MPAPQYFPLSPEMFALAGETVSRRVSRLPFLRSGVRVTGELIGVAMECLNAEFNKTLALRTPPNTVEKPPDGLDRCIEERLKLPGKTVVPVIVDVLCSAGIAETTEIMDRVSHRPRKGIRLLPPWTWHAASAMAPTVRLQGSGNDDASSLLSWMSMCPVCRTGILNRVVGKQLFGIPHTDFYIECSHCGAKFIPLGTQFRLVSIATVRDPLWRKYLNETFSAEAWSALARGTSTGGNQYVRQTEKPVSQSQKSPSGGLMQLKDGSLIVPFQEKTLYFKPVKLNFSGGLREDVFARAQKPLQEILKNPAFSHLLPQVNAHYSRYLSLTSGLFLGQLKERRDPFYREFLNSYGDEKYGTFRLEDSGEADKKGVLIVVVNKGIYHAVNCRDTFRVIINDVFGRISAEDCLLSGDSTRCRINALLCNNRSASGVSIHTCEKEEERQHITEILKGFISI
ncbi:hypothetical protein MUO74_10965 [Candidatus Bathyarchaeota archaeon]|nr:hypothetical protein [Candidatus Bathyarchaeota archaeon]